MERTYIKDAFGKKGEVLLKGWVHDLRDLSKIRFLILKDVSGRIQCVGLKGKCDEDVFDLIGKVPRESAVEIVGELKDSKQAPGGKEVLIKKLVVVAEAGQPLPIDVSDHSKTELPKRLDYRFLDLHREKTRAIFKIESTMMQAYREFMINEGALEAVFPSVIGASSEGGTEMFKLKYFEKTAYLSQSCQLYKQMLACAVEKVFTIFPVWRAEKHNTVQHLNESRQFDYEECFADECKVIDVLGRCVQFIVKKIVDSHGDELKLLEVNLKIPKVKYLKFVEVVDLMKKNKTAMEKYDLTNEAEKKLNDLFPDTIVFVHDWPLAKKPFYIMPKDEKGNYEKGDLSGGFDAVYKGIELASGGQRIHIPDLLIERLKANNLNPKDFKGYIDSFRYGAPPHAGWGMGLERLMMMILGMKNIREVTLFPRDRDRLSP